MFDPAVRAATGTWRTAGDISVVELHDTEAMDDRRKVVVVAGATSAIGAGVLRALRDSGARVVAIAHRASALATDGIEIEVADLTTSSEIASAVNTLTAAYPRIDGLVCLVSGFSGGTFILPEHRGTADVVDLNVGSATALAQELLPAMTRRGHGRIVCVITRPSIDLAPNSVAYAAARASIVGITRSLAGTLRGSGVTINCLIPERVEPDEGMPSTRRTIDAAGVTPEQIGSVIAFLCSDDAGVIQGAAIPLEAT
jgi:NAD(P)-dependent dehydrogenase (short-subunit alcohol dehydrogenase family)